MKPTKLYIMTKHDRAKLLQVARLVRVVLCLCSLKLTTASDHC
jgi:hypothetical protein